MRRENRHDASLTAASLAPPPYAVPLRAVRSGYVVSVNTVALQEIAIGSQLAIGVDASTAAPVVRGQSIGWVVSRAEVTTEASLPLTAVNDAVEIAGFPDSEHDIRLGIDIVVNIALAALSPAVNDPRTAVECVDGLAAMLTHLADQTLGPYGRLGADGTPSVVVAAATWADYVELATNQIIHYGSDDPTVVAALSRLAAHLERVAATRDDTSAVRALGERIRQAADPA